MSRLPRPYIPLDVRVQVAERQVAKAGFANLLAIDGQMFRPLRERLNDALDFLFGDKKPELHHRPALVNRKWIERKQDYDPPANDPDHLVYLAEDDHDVETRVRGQHGQHSDLGLRRKMKNIEKNREHLRSRGFTFSSDKSKPKMKSRPLRSVNRLPGKGQRPFRRSP